MSNLDIIDKFKYTDIDSLRTFAIDFLSGQIDWLNGQAVYFELTKD
jgi:hypothetical protein